MSNSNLHFQFIDQAAAQRYTQVGAWSDHILYDYLAAHADAHPDREAIVDPPNTQTLFNLDAERLTWQELRVRVEVIAHELLAQGIGHGDVVIVQLGNSWIAVACLFAITKLGAVVSPLSLQSRVAELDHALDALEPTAYIGGTFFRGFNHANYFRQSFPNFAGEIIEVEDLINASAQERGHKETLQGNPVSADDIATICWTSGTEGKPKAVPRTHNNWRASALGVSDGFGMGDKPERIMLPFPLINTAAIGGVTMPWLNNGGTLVLHHPFDIDIFCRQIVDERVSATLASPPVLQAMLSSDIIRQANKALNLRAVGCGSAAPSIPLLQHYEEQLGISIINMFGANEGTLLCSDRTLIPDAERRSNHFPRVGYSHVTWPNRAANWLQSKLIDPVTGEEVDGDDSAGVLAVKGPSIFPGYYYRGQFNRSCFTADGFYITGDLFQIAKDDEGPRLLKVIGRQKELVIRGGYNISPLEVDLALADLPGAREFATAGISDPVYGERLCLYVVNEPGAKISLQDVQTHLSRQGLAKTKWPERLVSVTELPRNALNKVVRSRLKDAALADDVCDDG